MRLFFRLAPSGLATLFALALPLAQAHAQEKCVTFSGLEHCALGEAQLLSRNNELHVVSPNASERDGVAISTEGSTFWSAGLRTEPPTKGMGRTVLTGESEGAAASTATLTTEAGKTTFAATFTAATQETATYTAEVFSNGRLVASVSNLPSGSVGLVRHDSVRSGGFKSAPRCTHQARYLCMAECNAFGYSSCSYCSIPCLLSFDRTDEGGSRWTIGLPAADLSVVAHRMAEEETVEGDMVVLTEEIVPGGSYPYLNFDRILIESNSKTTTLTDVTANGGK